MPVLHLTFDDGPHETFTPAILAVLERHGAHATFFQEGQDVERHPDITLRVHEAGHAIGNHAWDHPQLANATEQEVEQQLARTSAVIERTIGQRPTLFRPPYGSPFYGAPWHPTAVPIRNRAAALGMKTIIWDITPEDWEKRGRADITARVLGDFRVVDGMTGLVVLLHDAECAEEAENVAAVDAILTELGRRAYTFAAISDSYAGCALV